MFGQNTKEGRNWNTSMTFRKSDFWNLLNFGFHLRHELLLLTLSFQSHSQKEDTTKKQRGRPKKVRRGRDKHPQRSQKRKKTLQKRHQRKHVRILSQSQSIPENLRQPSGSGNFSKNRCQKQKNPLQTKLESRVQFNFQNQLQNDPLKRKQLFQIPKSQAQKKQKLNKKESSDQQSHKTQKITIFSDPPEKQTPILKRKNNFGKRNPRYYKKQKIGHELISEEKPVISEVGNSSQKNPSKSERQSKTTNTSNPKKRKKGRPKNKRQYSKHPDRSSKKKKTFQKQNLRRKKKQIENLRSRPNVRILSQSQNSQQSGSIQSDFMKVDFESWIDKCTSMTSELAVKTHISVPPYEHSFDHERRLSRQKRERNFRILSQVFDYEEKQEELANIPQDGDPPPSERQLKLENSNITQFLHHLDANYLKVVNEYDIGDPVYECEHCKAKYWLLESVSQTKSNPKYNKCCCNGRIKLAPLSELPEQLFRLFYPSQEENSSFTSEVEYSKFFFNNIRGINSSFAMTSTGISDQFINVLGAGRPILKVHGSIYHKIGSLLPKGTRPHNFAQIYFLSNEKQFSRRQTWITDNSWARDHVLSEVHDVMQFNTLVKIWKVAQERVSNKDDFRLVFRADVPDRKLHKKTQNKPSPSDFAVFLPFSNYNKRIQKRDIEVEHRSSGLKTLRTHHALVDPLSYPLFFPNGDPGWNLKVPLSRPYSNRSTVSAREYYRYRLQIRDDPHQEVLLNGGKLSQQYITDMFAKIEESSLHWYQSDEGQEKIRADKYREFSDALAEGDLSGIGKPVILPSSFTGGPRWYRENYCDALASVREFGPPDFFITMTCNWPEIKRQLKPGQTKDDRADIMERVFELKWKQLLRDVTEKEMFGKVAAHMSTQEWQKRSTPHRHLLLIMHEDYKPRTAADVNKFVSAEIPPKDLDPKLHDIIVKFNIHSPCIFLDSEEPDKSRYCRESRPETCKDRFPKEFQDFTILTENAFPLYKRRAPSKGGLAVKKHVTGRGKILCDNSWVVPYNATLSKKYNCHINVEIPASLKVVQYLYKYVYKGPDIATISAEKIPDQNTNKKTKKKSRNECENYLRGRWYSATESIHRIFELDLHHRKPSVKRLVVHLKDQQTVYLPTEKLSKIEIKKKLDRAKRTTLTAFFENNKREIEKPLTPKQLMKFDDGTLKPPGPELTYSQYPKHYRWDKSTRSWKRRKNRQYEIGRMYTADIEEGERFFLRLLLLHRKGPTSFEDLKKVNEKAFSTYKDVCATLGLLDDPEEWIHCFEEAASFQSGKPLRRLFTTILVFINPPSETILAIWEKFREIMSADFRLKVKDIEFSEQDLYSHCLNEIDDLLFEYHKTLSDFCIPELVPRPVSPNFLSAIQNIRLHEQKAKYKDIAETSLKRLNPDQKKIFDTICKSIDKSQNLTESKLFFIDGPAGTGKTFFANALLSFLRSKGDTAIAVATSGIAATKLYEGLTAHSMFRIPLDCLADTSCNIIPRSDTGRSTTIKIPD